MDYMAYDKQNDMYLVVAGTSWVPSKRRDLVRPSSKEKLERMINQVSKAYDGHFDIVPVSSDLAGHDPAPSALSVFDPALDRANEKNPPKPKVSVVHNMEVDKPIQLLIEAIDVLVTAAEQADAASYSDAQSKIDLEISRLYHRIETGKPDAVEMVKTYKQLKELLLERRKIKNALAVLLYIHSNPGLILTRMGLEKIRSLSDRAWVEEEHKND